MLDHLGKNGKRLCSIFCEGEVAWHMKEENCGVSHSFYNYYSVNSTSSQIIKLDETFVSEKVF